MDFALPRHQGAVFLDTGLHADHRRMFGDCVENFLARQHHAHRPASLLRQCDGNRFDLGINLAAVATAEVGHNDAHLRYWNFEYVGELGPYDEGILRRRPDDNPAPRLD